MYCGLGITIFSGLVDMWPSNSSDPPMDTNRRWSHGSWRRRRHVGHCKCVVVVEFCIKFPFLWYSQDQDRSGGWREIHVQKCIKTNAARPLQRSDNAAAVPVAMLAAAQSIPAGCHETKSPVWKSPLGDLRDEKGRCYFVRRRATHSSQITLRRTCCSTYCRVICMISGTFLTSSAQLLVARQFVGLWLVFLCINFFIGWNVTWCRL